MRAGLTFDLTAAIVEKRADIRRRADELRYLDERLAHLSGQLAAGEPPRTLITFDSAGKEEQNGSL